MQERTNLTATWSVTLRSFECSWLFAYYTNWKEYIANTGVSNVRHISEISDFIYNRCRWNKVQSIKMNILHLHFFILCVPHICTIFMCKITKHNCYSFEKYWLENSDLQMKLLYLLFQYKISHWIVQIIFYYSWSR